MKSNRQNFRLRASAFLNQSVSSRNVHSFFLYPFLVLQMLFLINLVTFFRYFSIDIGDSWWLFSPVFDGWCDPSVGQGVGGHCFGDYYLTSSVASQENPWDNNQTGSFAYPAGPILLFKGLNMFESLFAFPNIGLYLYLFLTALSLAVPAIMWRRTPYLGHKILIALGIISSVPGLLILDRGNVIGVSFGFILLFALSYSNKKHSLSILFLVAATILKPQFALFVLVFVFRREWKKFFQTVIIMATCHLVAFLAWPEALPNSLFQSFEATRTYGSTSNFIDPNLPNYSIGRGISGILSNMGISLDSTQVQVIVIFLLGVIGGAIFLLRERVSDFTALVYLGTSASFMVNITWGYYAIISLMFIFLLLNSQPRFESRLIVLSRYAVAFGAALSLSRLTFAIPTQGEWVPVSNSTSIGLMWLVICIILVFADSFRQSASRWNRDY